MLKQAKDSVDIGIVVQDIAASMAFYHDLLGLEAAGQVPVPFGTLHRLRFGSSDVKLIEPDRVPPAGPGELIGQLGFRYLTFPVTNLSQICERLAENGVPFTVPQTELRPGIHIAMVSDPDGNTVEFVQKDE